MAGGGRRPRILPAAISAGSKLLVLGTTDLDGTVASYLWDFGDGATSTQPSPQHTYTTPGDMSSLSRLRTTLEPGRLR